MSGGLNGAFHQSKSGCRIGVGFLVLGFLVLGFLVLGWFIRSHDAGHLSQCPQGILNGHFIAACSQGLKGIQLCLEHLFVVHFEQRNFGVIKSTKGL